MNREQRASKAIKHTEYIGEAFNNTTKKCIGNSIVYGYYEEIDFTVSEPKIPEFQVFDSISETAIKVIKDKLCVLNFASFVNPGGGFIKGSVAQEEALCHSSNLYNVLKAFQDEYNHNKEHLNHGFYADWAIYSPNVTFIYNEQSTEEFTKTASVITCPAPNKSRIDSKFLPMLHEALSSRIEYILNIAQQNNEKDLLLGAFGCGMFKNDPYEIASLFKEHLLSNRYSFDKVYFAIPSGKDDNLKTFLNVFEDVLH